MAETASAVNPTMTGQQMREYYLEQTLQSLDKWEKDNFSIRASQPFQLDKKEATSFTITPEVAIRLNLRRQVDEFAEEAKVSTAGVRENQNVLCSWDHRYRINEYIFALIAEAISRLVKELQAERVAKLPNLDATEIGRLLGPDDTRTIEEIFDMPLAKAIEFAREHPIRIVGGEVRSNTPRFVGLLSRIYAANGIHVWNTQNQNFGDTSTIFIWSFLTYILGLSGGDYFTSSHGAPQKQSDKILGPDGAQYLPPLYSRIVVHLYEILDEVEKGGYTIRLSAVEDPHLHFRLTYDRMSKLYANYLRKGPASEQALKLVHKAVDAGLRLKLDFFGGAGGKTISAIFDELGISKVFQGGLIRTEEDSFFHNIGFRVSQKKGSADYEVLHDSVDASLPLVVKGAGYEDLLKDAPDGQMIFNVDPDSDRFVVGQLLPASEVGALDKWGITHLDLKGRLFALYSPNQFFLMLAENDRVVAVNEGIWAKFGNFDVHTYVSALSWDEWAQCHSIPVVRVPVGFKEIAAVERQVEEAVAAVPGEAVVIKNELGEAVTIPPHPKLHHAGEESGGKIGGPREPIYNLFGENILGMREKSSGEACMSAISLAARLWLEAQQRQDKGHFFLHRYLETIFQESQIKNPMEFRGDIVHYNEAIFDPAELAKAKKIGIDERVEFNRFFTRIAEAKLAVAEVGELLSEAMPGMASDWKNLERVDHWSDGLQFWFKSGGKVRDLCLRPSGTDAKTKVYLDGTDKAYLQQIFEKNFKSFKPEPSAQYRSKISMD